MQPQPGAPSSRSIIALRWAIFATAKIQHSKIQPLPLTSRQYHTKRRALITFSSAQSPTLQSQNASFPHPCSSLDYTSCPQMRSSPRRTPSGNPTSMATLPNYRNNFYLSSPALSRTSGTVIRSSALSKNFINTVP
jgi:hypothetical protein